MSSLNPSKVSLRISKKMKYQFALTIRLQQFYTLKMSNSVVNLLYAFIFIGVARTQDTFQDTSSVCVLNDAPTQCGAFCLTALRPVFDQMDNLKLSLNIQADLIFKNQYRLENIERLQEDQMKRMEMVLAFLENRLSSIQSRVKCIPEYWE